VTVKRAVIPVMSITLDKVSITLEENQSTLLTATVLPENATDKSVTWTTSNSEVATVSDGRVTSVSEGEADITAQAGEQTATCKVTVKKVVVAVSSISLNKTSLQIIKGQSETLIATVSPDNATDKTVSWSSDDATIASVDQEGKVMGLKGGEVTIIAKAGEVSATCNVTIIVPVASVSLNKTELFIETGNTETLTATVLPEDATDKSVVWTSSNAQIVSVEGGIVSALKAGTAAITAVSGGIAASCVVSVKDYVFEITPNQVQLQADGGSFEVKVNTTHAYEVSSKPDWVTAVSVVNQVHTYEVGENPSMESRSGVIVYCDDKGTCIPCSVTQDGKSATPSGPFSINPSSVELESSGGEFAVTVTCPTTYSITSMSDWITEKSVNGNAHSFEVGSNPSGSERSGVIVFCDDAGNCIPCNVSQKGDSSAQSGPFSISPTSIDIDASGSEFDVTVTCSTSYEISSKPDWITEKSVNGKIHTFEVGINAEANDRSGNIVFCDDQGSCIPCIVRQKKSDGSSDGINWALEFYHRSFFMKFTATWCGWCPLMEKALLKAQAEEPNKILAANFHEATSNLAFYGTAALGRTYMISSFPTGVMDAREIIRNKEEPDATDILAALYRRETKLPVVTTVGWESSISGQQLSINLDVYVKKAGSYKATVLLVENGIIGYQVVHDVGEKNDYEHNNIVRMAVSGILGDGFTAAKDNSIFKKAYSVTIPEAYIKENLMILVYVQRAYGEGVSKIDSYDYDTWFVDNCNSGKAGESLTPEVIYVDGAGGNNEGIEIGDIINF